MADVPQEDLSKLTQGLHIFPADQQSAVTVFVTRAYWVGRCAESRYQLARAEAEGVRLLALHQHRIRSDLAEPEGGPHGA